MEAIAQEFVVQMYEIWLHTGALAESFCHANARGYLWAAKKKSKQFYLSVGGGVADRICL